MAQQLQNCCQSQVDASKVIVDASVALSIANSNEQVIDAVKIRRSGASRRRWGRICI